jgi:phenylacetate-CoA ligase
MREFAILFQILQSQWWTPEEIRAAQLRQAAALIAHAAAHVPFYRRRLADLATPPARGISPEEWARIPVLARTEVQEAGAALNADQLPEGHGPTRTVSTSGSTGRPVTVQTTELASHYRRAMRLRGNIWHRRDYAAKAAALQRLTDTNRRLAGSGAHVSWAAGYHTGPVVYRDVTGPVDDHLAWIAAEQPDYLITYPTMARALAERAIEQRKVLPRLKEIGTMGELLEPSVRDVCRRAWGVPVVDIYSTREIGVIGIQCPAHEHYHVQAEAVLVEIVDDAGQPCPPGAVGRVLVTPLHNYATPLIRYHVGDYAEAGAACSCGRGLPVISRIMGRARNMATLPNGERIFPSLDGRALAAIPPLRQLQLVQRSVEEIEVNLVVTRPLNGAELVRLRGALEKSFRHAFRWQVRYVDDIPRSAGGKYEDFRSELAT